MRDLLDPKSMFEQRKQQMEDLNNAANALFNVLDRNGDEAISREELGSHLLLARFTEDHVEKIFGMFDVNSDGEISRSELRAAFERYPPIRSAPAMGILPSKQRNALHAEADATFNELDINGHASPRPTRAWPCDSRRARARGARLPHRRRVSRSRAGDGLLELDELDLHLALKDGPEYSEAAVENIFRTLDTNGDGRVSPGEFREGYVRYRAMRLALGLKRPWELV